MAVEAAAVVVDDGPVVVMVVPPDECDGEVGAVWVTVFVVLAPLAQAEPRPRSLRSRGSQLDAPSSLVACRVRVCHGSPLAYQGARAAACHAPHWPTEVLLQK
jgi:hypothetical protein